MKLPAFQCFLDEFNCTKFDYDLARLASPDLKKPSDLFTEEQYSFIIKTILSLLRAFLAQYHEWLEENLSE